MVQFYGTKKEAEERLNDLLHRYHRSEVLEPSKILLSDWLDRWLDTAVKPGKPSGPMKRTEVSSTNT